MITKTTQITIFVKDREDAKKFYIEKLGFVVVTEMEFSSEWKYLTVAPKADNETVIELQEADSTKTQALIGKQASDEVLLMFASDDIELDYKQMKERGVVFDGKPKSVPGGKGVRFEDLYGNRFDLFQQEA